MTSTRPTREQLDFLRKCCAWARGGRAAFIPKEDAAGLQALLDDYDARGAALLEVAEIATKAPDGHEIACAEILVTVGLALGGGDAP